LNAQAKWIEAAAMLRQAVGILQKSLIENHPQTLIAMSMLGDALLGQGKQAEAIATCVTCIGMVVWCLAEVLGAASTRCKIKPFAEPSLLSCCDAGEKFKLSHLMGSFLWT
jgi:hypothetical protein